MYSSSALIILVILQVFYTRSFIIFPYSFLASQSVLLGNEHLNLLA